MKNKSSFDKSSIVPDTELSCHNCVNKKIGDISRKGDCYLCTKTNYAFMGYWKQTIAKDCKFFNKKI